jgi:NADPH:quinone reductase-like Zn-dependent oxidoreductase
MPVATRIQYHEYGGPEIMRLETFTVPTPGRHEVLVRVRAAGSNPMDGGIRRGRLKSLTGNAFPRGLGHDLSGIVEAVGAQVTRVHVGDEVLGFAGMKSSGAYGEFAIVDDDSCAIKPATLSFEEAATLPVATGTAYQALIKNGRLKAGQSVLITGCLGAVGRSAVAIALAHGATVTGSARSTRADEARAIGVSTVIDYDFDPKALTGRFDVILDSTGKLPYADAKAMLRPGGTIVDIIPSAAKFVRALVRRSYKVQATRSDPAQLDAIVDLAARGLLRLPITETVPLDRAVEAITRHEADDRPGRGKLVVTVG